jgi:hypothetical protein
MYSEPPDQQLYVGREALFEFFGGSEGRSQPMQMTWHHLAFNPDSQIGFGEYTFRYGDYQTHGIAIVQVSDHQISHWREYQYRSNLKWKRFTEQNQF